MVTLITPSLEAGRRTGRIPDDIGHIAKIIEHEITNQVVTYLESNKLLTTDQSAYRAQHSTQTALLNVVDD